MYIESGSTLKGRLRGLAKTGFAIGMHWSRLDKMLGARSGLKDTPLVIGYHRVVQDFRKSANLSIAPQLISTRTFEQQLDWLGRTYDFVSLDELVAELKGAKKHSKPVAAITFDDGYQDVYLNALPILKRKGIPSAVFVVTNLVGTRQLLVHDELYLLLSGIFEFCKGNLKQAFESLTIPPELTERLYHIGRTASNPFQATRAVLEFLSQNEITVLIRLLRTEIFLPEDTRQEFQLLGWDMLRDMVSQGVTVGSHSKSHALLTNESAEVVKDEIAGSRSELERHLCIQIKHFAYPDGRFSGIAVETAAAAGYCSAYTICKHQDQTHPLLTISRKMLWERSCMDSFGHFSPAILSCQVNGILDPARNCQLQHWA